MCGSGLSTEVRYILHSDRIKCHFSFEFALNPSSFFKHYMVKSPPSSPPFLSGPYLGFLIRPQATITIYTNMNLELANLHGINTRRETRKYMFNDSHNHEVVVGVSKAVILKDHTFFKPRICKAPVV